MIISSKVGLLAIVMLVLGACASARDKVQPALTMQVDASTPTRTPKPTRTPRPTQAHTPIPTVFGTPFPDYKTIPVPSDATAGMEVEFAYEFTTKQGPIDVIRYYEQILPPHGWEIQGTPSVESIGDDTIYVCITIDKNEGPLGALICASGGQGDELTYVTINLINTD